mmetsp:Transcript_2226/g.8570  ORF Transcript_2226/g.8570 Transcript_2226/m.8570 type:complete len:303 (+) Transcript_2226:1779-2687(+)
MGPPRLGTRPQPRKPLVRPLLARPAAAPEGSQPSSTRQAASSWAWGTRPRLQRPKPRRWPGCSTRDGRTGLRGCWPSPGWRALCGRGAMRAPLRPTASSRSWTPWRLRRQQLPGAHATRLRFVRCSSALQRGCWAQWRLWAGPRARPALPAQCPARQRRQQGRSPQPPPRAPAAAPLPAAWAPRPRPGSQVGPSRQRLSPTTSPRLLVPALRWPKGGEPASAQRLPRRGFSVRSAASARRTAGQALLARPTPSRTWPPPSRCRCGRAAPTGTSASTQPCPWSRPAYSRQTRRRPVRPRPGPC